MPHAPSNVPSRKVEKRTYAKCQEDVERFTCDCRCRFWPVCPRLPQKFEPPLTSPPNGTLESQTLKMWRKLVGPFSRLELRKKIFKLRPSKSNLGPLFFDILLVRLVPFMLWQSLRKIVLADSENWYPIFSKSLLQCNLPVVSREINQVLTLL